MDFTETKQLLTYLEQFYPNKRFADPAFMLRAWADALEPYDYQDVKQSAAAYVAQNKYFPDLPDLTMRLRRRGKEYIGRDDTALLSQLLEDGRCR